MHRGMLLSDLEALLRCRDCRAKKASLEATARIRKQAFVAGDGLKRPESRDSCLVKTVGSGLVSLKEETPDGR